MANWVAGHTDRFKAIVQSRTPACHQPPPAALGLQMRAPVEYEQLLAAPPDRPLPSTAAA
jgi:hypothetical protein